MAPYAARLASARAHGAAEPHPGQRFRGAEPAHATRSTRSPPLNGAGRRHRFIWLMGEDTVAQFHQWRRWRALARMVPIAVISRPGYDDEARAARAMGWLRRFVRPASQARNWTEWSAPAIIFLRLPPDRTSATRSARSQSRLAPPLHSEVEARRSSAIEESLWPIPQMRPPLRPNRSTSRRCTALSCNHWTTTRRSRWCTIPLAGKSSIADHMVIASGRSSRQVASMANKLADKIKQTIRPDRPNRGPAGRRLGADRCRRRDRASVPPRGTKLLQSGANVGIRR